MRPIVGIEERKEPDMTFHHHHKLDGCEWCEGRQILWGSFVLGLGILILGVILILDNFGAINAAVLAPYWPLLLVIVGVSHLVGPSSGRKVGWGLSWMAVGAIILLKNIGVIAVGIGVLWPVVIVILGANLVFRGARRRNRGLDRESSSGSTLML
jgi:uncharacterized membrane protein YkgB